MASEPVAERRAALRAALAAVVADAPLDGDLAQLVATARAEAEAEVRAVLRTLFVERLLREAGASRAEPEASPLVAPAPTADATTGWYVYGVAPVDAAAAIRGRRGVTGAPVDVVTAGGLAALVSVVGVEQVGGGDAPVTEPGWLEARVLAHDEVLRSTLDAGPVVPMRFATVVPDREDVERLLEHDGPRLARTLEQLRGRSEWGVKVIATDPEAVAAGSDELKQLAAELEAAPAGRAYLLRRQLEQAAQDHADAALDRLAHQCHEAVAGVAEALTRLAGRRDPGDAGEVVVDLAVLVSDDRRAALDAAVADLRGRYGHVGVTVDLTGPWPPYSFVDGVEPEAAA